jgi:hypothetical protein
MCRSQACPTCVLRTAGWSNSVEVVFARKSIGRTQGDRYRESVHDRENSKKSALKPWLEQRFCIPAEKSPAFVQAMEDVLTVYHRPYDPDFPQVCVDKTSKQLLGHVRTPIPAKPGFVARVDDEYKRCGTANFFLAIEPLCGRIVTEATERRTAVDFANFLKRISDVEYPRAKRIILVLDNLNTHSLASLYEAFTPVEARRLQSDSNSTSRRSTEAGSTSPRSDSQSFSGQVLDQRIASMPRLQSLLTAWHAERIDTAVQWRFTTSDARIKLLHLYPEIKLADVGRVGKSDAWNTVGAAASDPST